MPLFLITMFGRLFTFGCSCTSYHWMTWADICGNEAKQYYNLGAQGAGNLQSFIKLMEVDQTFHLTSDDTVMIMWTSVAREDRTVNSKWLSLGNIFGQSVYPEEWVKKFADPAWYLKRDLALISATIAFLKSKNIKYHMLQMMPIGGLEYTSTGIKSSLLDLYANDLKELKPSILEIIYNNDFLSPTRKYKPINTLFDAPGNIDSHPTPKEHYEYLKAIFPNWEFSQSTIDMIEDNQRKIKMLSG